MPVPRAEDESLANGSGSKPTQALQLAFALPTSPDTKVHLQITNISHALSVILATTNGGVSSNMASLGNLVYALPDRTSTNPQALPLSTILYQRASSIDFAVRLAKMLARKTNKPVYVGGDVKFWAPEDETSALRGCVDVVMSALG